MLTRAESHARGDESKKPALSRVRRKNQNINVLTDGRAKKQSLTRTDPGEKDVQHPRQENRENLAGDLQESKNSNQPVQGEQGTYGGGRGTERKGRETVSSPKAPAREDRAKFVLRPEEKN